MGDKVDHKEVALHNHSGTTLAADTYTPKNALGRLSVLAVSGPFRAVKGQSSGLYVREIAERRFLTVASGPSYTGESTGFLRHMQSPDVNIEDFQATADYLSILESIDVDKTGIIGICGWSDIAFNAIVIDPCIKVTAVSTTYNMSHVIGNGYFDVSNNEKPCYQIYLAFASQHIEDYRDDSYKSAGGVADPLPKDTPQFVRDYYAHHRRPCGYHARSLNSDNSWVIQANTSFLDTRFPYYTNEIRNAVLLVHDDKVHSYYMGKNALEKLAGDNKKMISAAGASHCDLYDQKDITPLDDIEDFINENLSK